MRPGCFRAVIGMTMRSLPPSLPVVGPWHSNGQVHAVRAAFSEWCATAMGQAGGASALTPVAATGAASQAAAAGSGRERSSSSSSSGGEGSQGGFEGKGRSTRRRKLNLKGASDAEG